MALTEEQLAYWLNVLENTGSHREIMAKTRVVPEDYAAYLDKVTRTKHIIDVPEVKVPVACYVSVAKEKMDNCPILINMHGGGFYGPQNIDDDMFCAHVAARIGGIVVDIDYALTPEHIFPVALEQTYAVAKWVFENCEAWGGNPALVMIGGHSAGGTLAAAAALKAAELGEFNFRLQILDYAAIDFYEHPDVKIQADAGGMPQERSKAFTRLYVGGDMNLTRSPFVSPVFATDELLSLVAPALIISALNCPMRASNEEYGIRMAKLGVEVQMKRFVNSRHGFTIRMIDEWREAQELIIRVINDTVRREGLSCGAN